jgi:hypothetical protein
VWRIRDVYPGSPILIFTYPGSGIPDLGSRIQKQQQKTGVKNFFCQTVFTQKIFTKPSKMWVWDPGSGKNLFRIPGSKRHRMPDPEHWLNSQFCRQEFSVDIILGLRVESKISDIFVAASYLQIVCSGPVAWTK